jgi:hypothetical protein
MSPTHRNRRQRTAAAVFVVLLAAAPMSGCGGSPMSASPTSASSSKSVSGGKGANLVPRLHRTGAIRRYARFAACMRKHGVSLPAPDTSGKGPIFDGKSLNPRSAAFKAADRKCAHKLFPHGPTGQ